MGKTKLDETYIFKISIKMQFFWCNSWYKYILRPYAWRVKTTKGNNKWKSNRWKTRILSASSKIWKKSKYFDKDLHQVVLSANNKNKKEEKEKKETKRKQQQNLTFLRELYEREKDTESNNKNQLEINEREVTI